MTINGLSLALGMILCIGATNSESMAAILILGSAGLGLMIMGLDK